MIKHTKADLKNNFVQIELSQDDLLCCLLGVVESAKAIFPDFVDKNFNDEEKMHMYTQLLAINNCTHSEDYEESDEKDYKKLIQKLALVALKSLKS